MRGPAAARLRDIVITANCDNSRSLRKLATILHRIYALNERNRMLSPDKISRKLGGPPSRDVFVDFTYMYYEVKSPARICRRVNINVFILPKITNFLCEYWRRMFKVKS